MSLINDLFTGTMGIAMVIFMLLVAVGDLYWLWMAINLGSFMMFAAGAVPPFFFITGPVGAWSLLFGVPDWVFNVFG